MRSVTIAVTVLRTKSSKALAEREEKVIFGGRLGEYKYYDMDAVIAAWEKSQGM